MLFVKLVATVAGFCYISLFVQQLFNCILGHLNILLSIQEESQLSITCNAFIGCYIILDGILTIQIWIQLAPKKKDFVTLNK